MSMAELAPRLALLTALGSGLGVYLGGSGRPAVPPRSSLVHVGTGALRYHRRALFMLLQYFSTMRAVRCCWASCQLSC